MKQDLTVERSKQNPEVIRVTGLVSFRKRRYSVRMRPLHTGLDTPSLRVVTDLTLVTLAVGGEASSHAQSVICGMVLDAIENFLKES